MNGLKSFGVQYRMSCLLELGSRLLTLTLKSAQNQIEKTTKFFYSIP